MIPNASRKPRIAVVLGDPAGIGPELVARLLAQPETTTRADLLVIADPDELRRGMDVAGQHTPCCEIESLAHLDLREQSATGRPVILPFLGTNPAGFVRGVSTAEGGRYSLRTLGLALDAVSQGHADAILFAPLNKHSLHLGGMETSDELHWFAQQIRHEEPVCEFNVLDRLWTSRVTSHIPLRDVARQVTVEGVIRAIQLIHRAMVDSGIEQPRIAVCGLNPHNGDNGSFGREELDVIGPAVAVARASGLPVSGPFPADTIFLKVQPDAPEYDGVVTMYHDQGQIAMKLMGFSRGVTVQGGLPIPIVTPAHGTAFDIAGQGRANPDATIRAFQLACRMALASIRQGTPPP